MHALTRRRPRPLLAALALLLLAVLVVLAGAVRDAGPSSAAAPVATAGVYVAASTAACGPERGVYITTAGDPKLLLWCGERAGSNSRVYFNPDRITPLWLRGADLTGTTEVGAARIAPVPSPSPSVSASPSPTASTTSSSSATGELAPVLSLDGVPAVVGSAGRVDIVWTPAKAPGGGSVAFYVVQGRASGEAAWTQRGSSTTATHAQVTGLTPGADYLLRIQAVYGDGTRGPWSNTLAVSVPLAVG